MTNTEMMNLAFNRATHNDASYLQKLINSKNILSGAEKELCVHMMNMVEGRLEREAKIGELNREVGRLEAIARPMQADEIAGLDA